MTRGRLAGITFAACLAACHADPAPYSNQPTRSGPSNSSESATAKSIHRFLTDELQDAALARMQYMPAARIAPTKRWTIAQKRYREDLAALLGVPGQCLTPSIPSGAIVEQHEVPQGRIEVIELEVCEGRLRLRGLLGISSVPGPRPLVIALHGTAASPEIAFGLAGADASQVEDYHHAFALRLMQAGFTVFAPELTTNMVRDPSLGYNRSRSEINTRALAVGRHILGIESGALLDALDYLLRHEAVSGSAGVYGISLGGVLAFFLGALDTRLDAVVVSQWIEDLPAKFADLKHPDAMWRYPEGPIIVVPGLIQKFSERELAALIAPRKLFVEVGARDRPRADFARAAFGQISDVYRRLETEAASVCLEVADAGHEVILNRSLDFLRHWLDGQPAGTLTRCDPD